MNTVKSYQGRWWFADRPDEIHSGTARFEPSSGWSIELMSGIPASAEIGERLPTRVLHGRTSTFESLTFPEARVHGYDWDLPKDVEATTDIEAHGALVGQKPIDPLLFERYTLGSVPLAKWARRPGMIEWDRLDRGHRLTIEPPDDIAIALPHGRLTLVYSPFGRVDTTSFQQTMSTGWLYEPHDPADLNTLNNGLRRPLDYMQVVLTGAHLGAIDTSVGIGQEGWNWVAAPFRPDPERLDRTNEWAFSLSQIDDLPALVESWFRVFDEIGPSLHPLMSVLTRDTPHKLETEILLLSYALEGYHRRRSLFSHQLMPASDHQQRIDKLVDGHPTEIRKWAREALNHTNQPSFASRVTDLIDSVGPIGDELSGNDLPKMARRYRDHVAHGLEPADAPTRDWYSDMFRTSRRLQALLAVRLLLDLGLPCSDVDERARRLSTVEFALSLPPFGH